MHYIEHIIPSEGYYLGNKGKQIVCGKVPSSIGIHLREDYNYNFYNNEGDLQTAINLIDPNHVYRLVDLSDVDLSLPHPSDEDFPPLP